MAKITLPTIAAGFASNSAFNTAYDLIEAEFQNKVLYRNNTSGEANKMEQALDMDGEAINNAGMITATGITVAGSSVTALVAAAAASAAAAVVSKNAAAASATAAANSFDSFDDRYLGAKSSNPSTDNDGNALITGAIYFNSSSNQILAWTSGDAWVAIKPTSTEQTAITAVAADATDIGAVAGKATEIGRLGTSAAVADLALLGTSAVVADMALLASTAVIADMAILGSATVIADMAILGTDAIVADMAILGTSDVVTDMNVLGKSDVVTDMNVLGTSANVTAMGVLGTSAVVANMATVASNVAGVNSFADLYRGASSSAPTGTITTGSLYYDTDAPAQLYIYNGSAWVQAAFSISGAVSSFNSRTGSVTLTSADVVGALATGAIATAKIADDAITADKLANSINSAITANTAKTGITSGQTSAITANTAKVTNATHTGDVTGATALTIGNNKVITDKILDSNVTTAKIADNAITLAKMASGTDGNIISYDASGNPVAVATGSSGQILTSAGAGAVPTFADAAGGGFSGTTDVTSASNITLSSDSDQIQRVTMTAADKTVKLPNATTATEGQTIFRIMNLGIYSLTIIDYAGNVLQTLQSGQSQELALLNNSTTAGQWSKAGNILTHNQYYATAGALYSSNIATLGVGTAPHGSGVLLSSTTAVQILSPTAGDLSIVGISFAGAGGRVPTWGTPVVVDDSPEYGQTNIDYCQVIGMGTNKGVVVYSDKNYSSPYQSKHYGRGFTISGNSVTLGSVVLLDEVTAGTLRFVQRTNTNDFVIGVWSQTLNAVRGSGVTGCSLSGTTISRGTTAVGLGYNEYLNGAVKISDGKFIINTGVGSEGVGWKIYSQSGTSLTAGTPSTTLSASTYHPYAHRFSDTRVYYNGRTITISGNNISAIEATNGAALNTPWMGPQNAAYVSAGNGFEEHEFESSVSGTWFGGYSGTNVQRQLVDSTTIGTVGTIFTPTGLAQKASSKWDSTTMILFGEQVGTRYLSVHFVDFL